MTDVDPTGTDWTDREIDLIVADYFEMLTLEIAGAPFVKSHRNSALQEITRRSRSSIEFKHQNISAVLDKLGLPWIRGYLPMANFQHSLVDGIERFLDARPATLMPELTDRGGIAEQTAVFFEPPPQLIRQVGNDPQHLRRLVRKFDPADRDARNRSLGRKGEERIFIDEQVRLRIAGRDDLSRKVRWVSREDGDGAGYDILSFAPTGEERLLEVKTTVGGQLTPFFLSENERSLSAERPHEFRLVRLYDFTAVPKAFQLVPPLEESVLLRPANYRASFHP